MVHYLETKKKTLFNVFQFVILFFITFFIGNSVLADTETISTYPFNINNYTSHNDVMCQSFVPNVNNASSIKIRVVNTNPTSSGLQFEICKGDIIGGNMNLYLTGTNPLKDLICAGTSTEVFSSFAINPPHNTDAFGQDFTINFSSPVGLFINENYYFCITGINQGEIIYIQRQNTGDNYVYGKTTNDNSALQNQDYYFTFYAKEFYDPDVEIMELPDYTGNIQIGSETLLQYNRHNFCFLGINEECHLKFNYGYDAIGSKIQLTTKSGQFIASTTVEDKYLLQDRFIIEEPLTAQTQEYCIAIDNGEDVLTYCDISLEWISNSWCAEESICAEVATSSDFVYGIQCGLRRTMCWVFQPTQSSIGFLTKTIDNFTNSFPFNLPFDFVKQIDYSIETASSSTKSFGLPMYSGETKDFYIVNGISPGMYYEILGTSTVNTLENQTDMVLWLLVSLLIVYIIWKFAIHKK